MLTWFFFLNGVSPGILLPNNYETKSNSSSYLWLCSKNISFNPEPCYVMASSNLEESSLNGYDHPSLKKETKHP